VAVPAYPPRNAKHLDRLVAIAVDCDAAVILTIADLVDQLMSWVDNRLPAAISRPWADRCNRASLVQWFHADVDFPGVVHAESAPLDPGVVRLPSHCNARAHFAYELASQISHGEGT